MKKFAPHQIDFYKASHHEQYPKGTEYVYSNLTARSGNHSNVRNSKGVVFIGLQLFIKDYLINEWNETFFNQPKDIVVEKYKRRISIALNKDVDVIHIEKLHDLGYLPISIKALPEGSFVPYKIPLLTITNTHSDFFWLPNFLESVLSNELWQMINSATTYFEYARVFHEYAELTGANKDFINFQIHDFSFRGMAGRDAAAKSGFAVLACGSLGTDTVAALDIAEEYYDIDDCEFIAGSVSATEHSTTSSSIEIEMDHTTDRSFAEFLFFRRLITEIYPTGIISIVSDTFDFWNVVDHIIPALKHEILQRNGKVVIRPDSGDPVDIICGTDTSAGLIEKLWNTFGGTVNSKGFKVLDPHIGAIYGDSITLERQRNILEKLMKKGFSSDNIVLGVGSYTYQMTSRDTHGIAMKATSCVVNGKRYEIYKDPKTDDGTKKSLRGLLIVSQIGNTFTVSDRVSPTQETHGCLKPVFENGVLLKETNLNQIRKTVNHYLKNL